MSWPDRIALVTGASRGIGRAIAMELAREGADVAVNYRKQAAAAEETAAEIRALGGRAVIVHADISDAAACLRMGHLRRYRHAHVEGFDLHANVAVRGEDRERREQLCRYLLRPAVAQDRLRLTEDGRIVLELKRPWQDGTSYFVFEPLDLLAPTGRAHAAAAHQPHHLSGARAEEDDRAPPAFGALA